MKYHLWRDPDENCYCAAYNYKRSNFFYNLSACFKPEYITVPIKTPNFDGVYYELIAKADTLEELEAQVEELLI